MEWVRKLYVNKTAILPIWKGIINNSEFGKMDKETYNCIMEQLVGEYLENVNKTNNKHKRN